MSPKLHKSWTRWLTALLIVASLGICAAWVHRLLADPSIVFLTSDGDAQWLRVDRPFDVGARFVATSVAAFETPFVTPQHLDHATLRIAALRRGIVSIDGKQIFDTGTNLSRWKTTYAVPLPTGISPGMHHLRVIVANDGGPALVRVSCPQLKIESGDGWITSDDAGRTWRRAVPAERPWQMPSEYPTAEAVMRFWPLLVLLFVPAFFQLLRRPPILSANQSPVDWGRRMRWVLLGAWTILALNNFCKLPLRIGYDINAHYQYILYVAQHGALPRPDASWQYFQSPLYYMISAVFLRLLELFGVTGDPAAYALRLIPLACGAAMVEMSYRSARLLFPQRGDLQAIAAAVGGLLPVNLYMAQTVSNESMAGTVSALLFVAGLRFVMRPSEIRLIGPQIWVGGLLGAAWLTKVSALIWSIPLAIILVRAMILARAPLRVCCRSAGLIAAAAITVSGWYFIRNIVLVGKPFYAQAFLADARWWQDPGYRTPQMFLKFGHVFTAACFSGIPSVWDSIYSTMWADGMPSGGAPPWNFSLMACALCLSVLPAGIILAGIARSIYRPGDDHVVRASLRFASLVTGCFVGAIACTYLLLPIYCVAKASYMLGATPCLAVLAAGGFDLLTRRRVLWAVAGGILFTWAVTGYLTYFLW
jgi:hypothetical protein